MPTLPRTRPGGQRPRTGLTGFRWMPTGYLVGADGTAAGDGP
jgi:hypothetical protein